MLGGHSWRLGMDGGDQSREEQEERGDTLEDFLGRRARVMWCCTCRILHVGHRASRDGLGPRVAYWLSVAGATGQGWAKLCWCRRGGYVGGRPAAKSGSSSSARGRVGAM
jgi:hypothetical protein